MFLSNENPAPINTSTNMDPSHQTDQTTRKRKTQTPTDNSTGTQTESPLLVSGNDAYSPKRTHSPISRFYDAESQTQEEREPELQAQASKAEVVADSDLSMKMEKRGASSTHGSYVELGLGFFIVLSIFLPVVVGKIPMLPAFLYHIFADHFAVEKAKW